MIGFLRMLVRNRVISTTVALSVLSTQRQLQTPIGQLAVQRGLLTQLQVLQILERQQASTASYTPFGQIGIELGLLAPGDVAALISDQRCCRPAVTSILAEQHGLSASWLASAAKHYASASEGSQAAFQPSLKDGRSSKPPAAFSPDPLAMEEPPGDRSKRC